MTNNPFIKNSSVLPQNNGATKIGLHWITLRFKNGYENEFLGRYFKSSLLQFRIAFILVSILYAAFAYLDVKMASAEDAETFITIRLVVVPFLLMVFGLSFFSFFQRIWQPLLFFSFLIAGFGISVMLIMLPDNSVYYGGMMLIFIAGYFFIKLRFLRASLAGWLTLLFYNLGALLFSDTSTITLIGTNFFYISANVIGMVAAYNIELLARKDFLLNKKLDKQKEHLEDWNKNLEKKVEERTIELVEAKERAEESDRLKSAFLANMSHEIRTPMNGILGYTQLLLEAEDEEELKEFVFVIRENGKHLLSLIDDIIDLSKIEAGLFQLTPSDCALNSLIDDVVTLFSQDSKIASGKIKLHSAKSFADGDDHIITDQTRLKQILINLVGNACKFTSQGFIEVGYQRKGEMLQFHVKDTGIGIEKTQQTYIFERFMQATIDHKPKNIGTGLGLAISKAFINIFGGEIWLDSEPGRGSTFFFTIPMKAAFE